MSAFCDIWLSNKQGDQPTHTRFGDMRWEEFSGFGNHTWHTNSESSKCQVQEAKDGDYSLLLLGQLYEAVNLTDILRRCVEYIENCKPYKDVAGHYVLFVRNKQSGKTYVFTNRLGTWHVYHYSSGSTNRISTCYLGLAKQAEANELNWPAISSFMQMGFFAGNDTYLKQIKILPPATCSVFDKDLQLVNQERYWNWTFEPVSRSAEAIEEELHSILSASLNVALKDKRVSLPISGGLDSRLLTGMVAERGHSYQSLWSYSYGLTEKSAETKIAVQIAEAASIPFSSYTVPNYLFDKADTITASVELFQYLPGTRQACMVDILNRDADTVIGGHWGDVWMDDMGTAGMDLNSWFQKKIVKKGSEWLVKEICEPHFPKAAEELKAYFHEWNERYAHVQDTDFRMKIFKTDQWSFRWTIPSLRMYQAAVLPVLPFYDNRVVNLFTTIPTDVVKGREFEVSFIKRYYPELAKIRWQEYDSNLFNYKRFNNRHLIYRAVSKGKRMLSGEKPVMRNWELFYLNDTGRKELESILIDNPAFCEIVPATRSKALLDTFYKDPSAGNGYAVSMMHTLAQFMKTVF